MFRSILVPLDGSVHSEHALDLATWIALRAGAAVRICHVREATEPGFAESTIEDDAALLSHFEEYLGVLARRVTHRLGRVISHQVVTGAPVARLIGLAREAEADLIVLTTHGHGGPSHAWLGGTAEGLTRQASIPLMLVRPSFRGEAVEDGFGRILVPLDGSLTAESALPAATDFASLADAAVHLLAVVELPVELPAPAGGEPVRLSGVDDPGEGRQRAHEYLADVAERLRARGLQVETEVRDAISPASAILQAAADVGADAIAMATHGRSRLRRMAVGSVSDKVIRAAGVPVLLVPARDVETKRSRLRAAAAAADA